MSTPAVTASTPLTLSRLLYNWRYSIATCNCPRGSDIDEVTRWLVLTRACVQPMTLIAVFTAGLLAVRAPGFNPLLFGLAALGAVLAHANNNLMNDLFDLEVGNDTRDYPRALYAPHPVLSGMISRGGLVRAALAINVVDALIMVFLIIQRGWPVLAFALAGLFISVGYTAPPLRLKKRGLGEPGVFLVWGPLMIGGTYFAATGTVSWQALLASIPYGLLVTAVLMGKHIDKLPWDAPKKVGTLPYLLGEARARVATEVLMVAFFPVVVLLILAGALPLAAVVVVLAAPRLLEVLKRYREPRPEAPPENYPVWPLWYVASAFIYTRRAGGLLLVGLLAGAIFPSLYLHLAR